MEILLIKPNHNNIIVQMTFRGKRFQVREKPDKPRLVFFRYIIKILSGLAFQISQEDLKHIGIGLLP